VALDLFQKETLSIEQRRQMIKQLLDQGHPPHSLFFSKVNLLVENWAEWESTVPSSFKLGLAVATAKNIRHRDFGFFGSYIFEIVLPANRLIAAPKAVARASSPTFLISSFSAVSSE